MSEYRSLHEECGIFGVFGRSDATELVYRGLREIQHRGQESCGIAWVRPDRRIGCRKGRGLVSEVFGQWCPADLAGAGEHAIGHVRYSTAGGGNPENTQPFVFRQRAGEYTLAHNGNIVNADILKKRLCVEGSIFESSSDSEIVAHLINKTVLKSPSDYIRAIRRAMNQLDGAVSLLVMTPDAIFACRDRFGFRPLSVAELSGGYVVSSETCALVQEGCSAIRDVNPGEILMISRDGIQSFSFADEVCHKMCAMEYIYFARADSVIEGVGVHSFRKAAGRILFEESPVAADMVIGVPDSGLSAALGYSEASGIPLEPGLVRNAYVGRTFIQPTQTMRDAGVKMKLSPIRSLIRGKRLVVIDDSIVRGTTSKKIIRLLREAGASEVHMRISSPMITGPCFYGVDIAVNDNLLCASNDCQAACKAIEADSLGFISEAGLLRAGKRSDLCLACFNRDYPTSLYGQV
ncbi:MAG: amidophosphoribosyltransferase [Bacteroidales bacterium]|nr:amidophosphoribosyltransferase [Bacteroidales bacterium]